MWSCYRCSTVASYALICIAGIRNTSAIKLAKPEFILSTNNCKSDYLGLQSLIRERTPTSGSRGEIRCSVVATQGLEYFPFFSITSVLCNNDSRMLPFGPCH